MRPRLWLHVGDHKTGSTAIQRALHDRLWTSDIALIYPPYFNDSSLARTGLRPGLRERWRPVLKERADWLRGDADVAVMSAEHFAEVEPARIDKVFRQDLPEHAADMRVIAYVRPHAPSLLSTYAQRTKCGTSVLSLADYSSRALTNGVFDYFPRFSAWRDVFGDRFVLRTMDRGRLVGGDVVRDFLSVVLGGADFELTTPEGVNESLGVVALSAVREVQKVLRERDVDSKVRVTVGSYFGARVGTVPIQGVEDEKIRLDRHAAIAIRDASADDARAMDAAFFEGQGDPMTLALDQAVDSAVADAQSHNLEDHVPTAAVVDLQRRASSLADALLSHGVLWKRTWHAEVGHKPGKLAESSDEREGVERIAAAMTDTTTTIAELVARR